MQFTEYTQKEEGKSLSLSMIITRNYKRNNETRIQMYFNKDV